MTYSKDVRVDPFSKHAEIGLPVHDGGLLSLVQTLDARPDRPDLSNSRA